MRYYYANLAIAAILFLVPLVYLSFLKVFLRKIFISEAALTMFLLYSGPFWFLLIFITGVELYRRRLIGTLQSNQPVYFIMAGGVLVSIVVILISPDGPALISLEAVILIGSSLLVTTVAGLIIRRLINRTISFKE